MQPCEHRNGEQCCHPLNEIDAFCVMTDPRAADCRWWKSDRLKVKIVTAPWAPKPSPHVPPPPFEFVGPPKPHHRQIKRAVVRERKKKLEKLATAGKLASPFDSLFKDPK